MSSSEERDRRAQRRAERKAAEDTSDNREEESENEEDGKHDSPGNESDSSSEDGSGGSVKPPLTKKGKRAAKRRRRLEELRLREEELRRREDELLRRERKRKRKVSPEERRTTVRTRTEERVRMKYTGGMNLQKFERHFNKVARKNQWDEKEASDNLRNHLSRGARKFIEGKLKDTEDDLITAESVFDMLRKRFVTLSGRLICAQALDDCRQHDKESVADFAARFCDLLEQADQKDDSFAAGKFFRALKVGDGVPYAAEEFKCVDDVVILAMRLEHSTQLREGANERKGKKAHRRQKDLSSSNSDGSSQEFSSLDSDGKAESDDSTHLKRRQKEHSRSRRSVQEVRFGHLRDRHLPSDSVHSGVQSRDAVHPTSRREFERKAQTGTAEQANSGRPDLRTNPCGLCGVKGHIASECDVLKGAVCQMCGRGGHIAFDCPQIQVCSFCGVKGHVAMECWRRLRVERERGQERDGRDLVRRTQPRLARPEFDGRNGPFGTNNCYHCGRRGHFARECPDIMGRGNSPERDHRSHPHSLAPNPPSRQREDKSNPNRMPIRSGESSGRSLKQEQPRVSVASAERLEEN